MHGRLRRYFHSDDGSGASRRFDFDGTSQQVANDVVRDIHPKTRAALSKLGGVKRVKHARKRRGGNSDSVIAVSNPCPPSFRISLHAHRDEA